MPLYEYQCQQCGTRSEALQKHSDAPLTTCDKCGGELRRLLSAPAFQFKGAGWYVTDYARKSGSPGGRSDGKPSDGAADGGSKADQPAGAAAGSSTGGSSGGSSSGSE